MCYPAFVQYIDWEFVTSVLKIRKTSRIFAKFLKFVKNSFYRITSNCKVFEFAQQLITLTQPLNGNSGQLRIPDSDTGEDSEAAGDSYTL